jgi:hypothetical protein
VGKGNHKSQKSALKLVEIGPRLSLELIKVEKGIGAMDDNSSTSGGESSAAGENVDE